MIDFQSHPGRKFQDIFKVSKGNYLHLLNELLDIVETFYGFLLQMEYKAHLNNLSYSTKVQNFMKLIVTTQEEVPKIKMKCLVFGSSLVGKSTLLNALLGMNVFTVNSDNVQSQNIIQLEGTNEDHATLKPLHKDNPIENKSSLSISSLDNVDELVDKEILNDDELVLHVRWPVDSCPCIGLDSCIIDTPGLGPEEQHIKWIDQYWPKANCFVFVMDGSRGHLTNREQNYLRQIMYCHPQAIILCVVNFWDCVTLEFTDTNFLRNSLLDEFVNLMVKELHAWTVNEATDRVFFVSSEEMTIIRRNGLNSNDCKNQFPKGWLERAKDFMRLEENLWSLTSENCIWKDLRHSIHELKEISKSMLGMTKEISCLLSSKKDILQSAIDNRHSLQAKLTLVQEELNHTTEEFIDSQCKTSKKFMKNLIMNKLQSLEEILNEMPCHIPSAESLATSVKLMVTNYIKNDFIPTIERETTKHMESVIQTSKETLSELYINRFAPLRNTFEAMFSSRFSWAASSCDTNPPEDGSSRPSVQFTFQILARSSCTSGAGFKFFLKPSVVSKSSPQSEAESAVSVTQDCSFTKHIDSPDTYSDISQATTTTSRPLFPKSGRTSSISFDSKIGEYSSPKRSLFDLKSIKRNTSHSDFPSMVFSLNTCMNSVFTSPIEEFLWKSGRQKFEFSLSFRRLYQDSTWHKLVNVYRNDARPIVRWLPICSTKYLYVSGLGLSVLIAMRCWRTLAALGGSIGGLYLYEYCTWSVNHMKQQLIRKFSRHMYLMASSRIDILFLLIKRQITLSMRSAIHPVKLNIERSETELNNSLKRLKDLDEWTHKYQQDLFELNNKALTIDNRLREICQSQCHAYISCCYRQMSSSSQLSV